MRGSKAIMSWHDVTATLHCNCYTLGQRYTCLSFCITPSAIAPTGLFPACLPAGKPYVADHDMPGTYYNSGASGLLYSPEVCARSCMCDSPCRVGVQGLFLLTEWFVHASACTESFGHCRYNLAELGRCTGVCPKTPLAASKGLRPLPTRLHADFMAA